MPEGPEIRRAADWLRRYVGARIVNEVRADDRPLQIPVAALPLSVNAVDAHGKVLWMECTTAQGAPVCVVLKLNLTGQLSTDPSPHTRATLVVETPMPSIQYADATGFGWMKLMTPAELGAVVDALGPDPLKTPLDGPAVVAALAAGGKPVAAKLLDQERVAGVGNYLRAEVVFAAQLSEEEWAAPTLSREAASRLAAAVNAVCRDAYELGPRYVLKCYKVAGMSEKKVGGRAFYFLPR